MAFTWLHGYPATLGGKVVAVGWSLGPASYTPGPGGGLTLYNKALRSIDMVIAAMTLSGNYSIQAQPATKGNAQKWYLRFFYAGAQSGVTGAVVTLGTGSSNATYTIDATSGAGVLTVVVAGGAITSVVVTNPGSYTIPPTFTPPAGLGSGASIVATVGSLNGQEVGSGLVLSGETVQVALIGG